MPGPDFDAMNAAFHKTLESVHPEPKPMPIDQAAGYGLQAADAFNSASHFRHGEHERNPFMAPYSHGGAPTMLAGFAIGDVIRNLAMKHASEGNKHAAMYLQAAANLIGIALTNTGGGSPPTPKANAFQPPAPPPERRTAQ